MKHRNIQGGLRAANHKKCVCWVDEEGKEESSSALGYGLSLAQTANAHLTVQVASLWLVLNHAIVNHIVGGLVSAENHRLHALSNAVAEQARGNAALAGVPCTVESLQLPPRIFSTSLCIKPACTILLTSRYFRLRFLLLLAVKLHRINHEARWTRI